MNRKMVSSTFTSLWSLFLQCIVQTLKRVNLESEFSHLVLLLMMIILCYHDLQLLVQSARCLATTQWILTCQRDKGDSLEVIRMRKRREHSDFECLEHGCSSERGFQNLVNHFDFHTHRTTSRIYRSWSQTVNKPMLTSVGSGQWASCLRSVEKQQ